MTIPVNSQQDNADHQSKESGIKSSEVPQDFTGVEEISQSEIEEVSDRPSAPIADDGSGLSEHSNIAPSSAEIPGEKILQKKVAGDLLFLVIFIISHGLEFAVLSFGGFFETLFEDKGCGKVCEKGVAYRLAMVEINRGIHNFDWSKLTD